MAGEVHHQVEDYHGEKSTFHLHTVGSSCEVLIYEVYDIYEIYARRPPRKKAKRTHAAKAGQLRGLRPVALKPKRCYKSFHVSSIKHRAYKYTVRQQADEPDTSFRVWCLGSPCLPLVDVESTAWPGVLVNELFHELRAEKGRNSSTGDELVACVCQSVGLSAVWSAYTVNCGNGNGWQ